MWSKYINIERKIEIYTVSHNSLYTFYKFAAFKIIKNILILFYTIEYFFLA